MEHIDTVSAVFSVILSLMLVVGYITWLISEFKAAKRKEEIWDEIDAIMKKHNPPKD